VTGGADEDVARSFDQNWSKYRACAREVHRYTSHGALGWLVLADEEVHVGPGLIKWAFALAYDKPWWSSPGFYSKVKPRLRSLLIMFVHRYGYSPVEAPNFFRKFLSNNGVP
jgi:hypothetical protein